MVKGVFYFDPEDDIYADHFPGHPVVPGSVIIHAFSLAVEKHLGGGAEPSPDFNSARKFRFKRFITPGRYAYSLLPRESVVECRLFSRERIVATGSLCI